MPDECATYPSHTEIVKYFNDYVDHFGVRRHIRFNTQVVKVEQRADGSWQVAYRDSPDGTPIYLLQENGVNLSSNVKTEDFDAVMVCNGHHSTPVRTRTSTLVAIYILGLV